MMKTKLLLMIIIFCVTLVNVNGQALMQTIKGRIIDKQSKEPLIGATVVVMDTNPIIATTTDVEGYYRLENVETGRKNVSISFVGYQTVQLTNLNLTSGKELILDIEMEEKIETLGEVVVVASKSTTNNTMVTLSSRKFTIEETQRYAGARNDVARMAANYAGVSSNNDAENGIIIRGNSPNGLLWRLDGIEIPNPNHYGFMGSTGGPVSMLNNNVLSNSDFMTAAFPAEYGNAFSGVFDLKMRNGNYDKHEFLGQVGFNGFEFGAEGPVFKNNSSYIINYRYSTLGVLKAMGANFGTGVAVPYYQDLSYKLNIHTSKAGTFSLFGLAGKSSIDLLFSERDTTGKEDLYNDRNLDIYNKNSLGVIGLNHFITLPKGFYSKFSLAATAIENKSLIDSVSLLDNSIHYYGGSSYANWNYIASYQINKKFSSRLDAKIGLIYTIINYKIIDSTLRASGFNTSIDERGFTSTIQSYFQVQYKFTDNFILNTGVHYQYLVLNGESSIEPRAGLVYHLNNNHAVSVAYGLHGKHAPIQTFFTLVDTGNRNYERPNLNLGFEKTHHFVLGYDYNISRTLRLKTEIYYQKIFDALVGVTPSYFSMLNYGGMEYEIPDYLKNGGTGYNYGAEVTFEKFLDKGLYYLFTLSVFDSKYKGSDGKLRSTVFDSDYVLNILAGKEFSLKSRKEFKKKFITIDGRVTSAGGKRYSPVDFDASLSENKTVYFEDMAYTERFADYFRADIRTAYRIDGKRVSHELAFDIQNVTNKKNPFYQKIDIVNKEIKTVNQLQLMPMMQYRLTF